MSNGGSAGNHGEIIVTFIGSTPMEFRVFIKALTRIKILIVETVNVTDPDSITLKIKNIKRTKEHIIINLFIRLPPYSMSIDSLLNIIKYYRKIKTHLESGGVESSTPEGESVWLENINNESRNFPASVVNLFFNNPRIDRAMIALGKNNNRKHISLNTEKTTVNFSRATLKIMKSSIFRDDKTETTDNVTLLVRSPVLPKEPKASNWSFFIGNTTKGKKIEATVTQSFLDRVHSGEIKFKSGSVITCKLKTEIITKITAAGKNTSKKRTVTEVFTWN